jgi:hypothetical protein
MEYTTIYKVYGCNEDGKPILWAEFLDLRPACKYAVAKQGKIHYGLPEVEKHTYCYDPDVQAVSHVSETISPAQIHYMNKI